MLFLPVTPWLLGLLPVRMCRALAPEPRCWLILWPECSSPAWHRRLLILQVSAETSQAIKVRTASSEALLTCVITASFLPQLACPWAVPGPREGTGSVLLPVVALDTEHSLAHGNVYWALFSSSRLSLQASPKPAREPLT